MQRSVLFNHTSWNPWKTTELDAPRTLLPALRALVNATRLSPSTPSPQDLTPDSCIIWGNKSCGMWSSELSAVTPSVGDCGNCTELRVGKPQCEESWPGPLNEVCNPNSESQDQQYLHCALPNWTSGSLSTNIIILLERKILLFSPYISHDAW
jgi:hypothetical protein